MATSTPTLLGEWACLGILHAGPAHGFAIATRLRPSGDVGHVWSLSRPLTYRALDKLNELGCIEAVAEEPGIAGGTRTVLAATGRGRRHLRAWLARPVAHVRDLRSELLLKLVIADLNDVDVGPMLEKQRAQLSTLLDAFSQRFDPDHPTRDVVLLWRWETVQAAVRFLDRITPAADA